MSTQQSLATVYMAIAVTGFSKADFDSDLKWGS
jgi:hypothetical protein